MSKVARPLREPFALHCQELLSPLGTVRMRAMFGGVGFYVDDCFIALIADGRFFLKAGAQQLADFERAGCAPFTYDTKDGRRHALGYREAPQEALESADAMRPWARRALEAALQAANAKPATRRSPKPRR